MIKVNGRKDKGIRHLLKLVNWIELAHGIVMTVLLAKLSLYIFVLYRYAA